MKQDRFIRKAAGLPLYDYTAKPDNAADGSVYARSSIFVNYPRYYSRCMPPAH